VLSSLHATPSMTVDTLSLHDALPISTRSRPQGAGGIQWLGSFTGSGMSCSTWIAPFTSTTRRSAYLQKVRARRLHKQAHTMTDRSEEHTSELQSREKLVCRLLLEKKK